MNTPTVAPRSPAPHRPLFCPQPIFPNFCRLDCSIQCCSLLPTRLVYVRLASETSTRGKLDIFGLKKWPAGTLTCYTASTHLIRLVPFRTVEHALSLSLSLSIILEEIPISAKVDFSFHLASLAHSRSEQ
ncbi:unnamed protein product, partial [Protopolystoma xenopodis]